jgi:hypothetical protein
MAPEELRKWQAVNPFRPFDIFMASGHRYTIVGRECMTVTGSVTAIAVRPEGEGDMELVLLDNFSITHVSPVNVRSAT